MTPSGGANQHAPSMVAKRKSKPPAFPQAERVHAYARAVVNDRIGAGHYVRLACQRHLDDMEKGAKRGLRWKAERAEAAISFFEDVLFLSEDVPFKLEDFQAFIVGSLYGWWKVDPDARPADKKAGVEPLVRRFRTFYGEMGKGNGKTPLAAGLGLYALWMGFDKSPEVYSAAADKQQARICFDDATAMVQASPELRGKIAVLTHSLTIPKKNAKFVPLSNEDRGKHGKRVAMATLDEIHAHESAKMVRAMVAGTKNCKNALIALITNSGHDRRSICWSFHEAARKMLEGAIKKDDLFAYVCTLDPCPKCASRGAKQPNLSCPRCDDFRDEKNWIKANPGLGTICRRGYVAERVQLAKDMPSEFNDVMQLNFCRWMESAGGWANMGQWDNACQDTKLRIEAFAGQRAALAMDAANRVDVTSLVAVVEREPGSGTLDLDKLNKAAKEALQQSVARQQAEAAASSEQRAGSGEPETPAPAVRALSAAGYVTFSWHFVPEAMVNNAAAANHEAYQEWRDSGELIVTPGAVTDFDTIEAKLKELAALLAVARLQYDPRELAYFMQRVAVWASFELVEVSQSPAMISQPMKEVEALIAAALIKHDGNRVMRWMLANVVQKTTKSGGPIKYYFPTRPEDGKKIDGAVALIMAVDGMLRAGEPGGEPGVIMLG